MAVRIATCSHCSATTACWGDPPYCIRAECQDADTVPEWVTRRARGRATALGRAVRAMARRVPADGTAA